MLWVMLDSTNKEATMSVSLTNIQPTDSGWVLDMTPEMIRVESWRSVPIISVKEVQAFLRLAQARLTHSHFRSSSSPRV